MIELSYNTKKLKRKIYEESGTYHDSCLIEALAEIIGEISEETIKNILEHSDLPQNMRYEVKVEGAKICCNYAYSNDRMHILRGTGRFITPDGTFHVDVWVSTDTDKGCVRIKKVSVDLYNDLTNLPGIKSIHSVRGNMIEGLSAYVDSDETELQDIVDGIWEEMRKYTSDDCE